MTPKGHQLLDELRIEQGLDPSLPWGGRSPRCLTRGHELRILSDDAAPLDEFLGDEELIEEQCRRHFHGS